MYSLSANRNLIWIVQFVTLAPFMTATFTQSTVNHTRDVGLLEFARLD